ncbi:MAG: hypothetical protein RLY34_1051 [Actinomycetota bacterium]|jgi:hypothetical protein
MRLPKNQPSGWFLGILSKARAFDFLTINLWADNNKESPIVSIAYYSAMCNSVTIERGKHGFNPITQGRA